VPLAVFATLDNGRLGISGLVGTPDGGSVLRADGSGPAEDVETLSAAVAEDLLGQGAAEIIAALAD
jgi:hydroxymethylbilane synthase